MSGSFGADGYTTKMWAMELDPNGEWVRYEDVQYKDQLKDYVLKYNGNMCNCENECNIRQGFHSPIVKSSHWICPAHGYKRL